jgi:hypothetical protein
MTTRRDTPDPERRRRGYRGPCEKTDPHCGRLPPYLPTLSAGGGRSGAATRDAGLPISVRRGPDVTVVEHLDHAVTQDQHTAFAKAVHADIDGRGTWDLALHDAARDRLLLSMLVVFMMTCTGLGFYSLLRETGF